MLNIKQTLKNLHKKFPMMSLDELFELLDCYVEESYLKTDIGLWNIADIGSTTISTTKTR